MSNGEKGYKDMEIGAEGWAQFPCEARSVSVWVVK